MDHMSAQHTPPTTIPDIVHADSAIEPLITKFMIHCNKQTGVLREALQAQNFEEVRLISHGLKGAGGAYGFDRVSEFGAAIERAAKTADIAAIDRELQLLTAYLAQVTVIYD